MQHYKPTCEINFEIYGNVSNRPKKIVLLNCIDLVGNKLKMIIGRFVSFFCHRMHKGTLVSDNLYSDNQIENC